MGTRSFDSKGTWLYVGRTPPSYTGEQSAPLELCILFSLGKKSVDSKIAYNNKLISSSGVGELNTPLKIDSDNNSS